MHAPGPPPSGASKPPHPGALHDLLAEVMPRDPLRAPTIFPAPRRPPPRRPRKVVVGLTGHRRKDEGERSPRAKRTARIRDELLDIVAKRPGISLTAITREMNTAWSGVYHHLRALEREGKVKRVTHGRRRLLYPINANQPDPVADGLLHGATARLIAQAIAEHEQLDIAQLEMVLDLKPRVAYYHVRKLLAAALITAGSTTRYRELRATQRLLQALGRPAQDPTGSPPRPDSAHGHGNPSRIESHEARKV